MNPKGVYHYGDRTTTYQAAFPLPPTEAVAITVTWKGHSLSTVISLEGLIKNGKGTPEICKTIKNQGNALGKEFAHRFLDNQAVKLYQSRIKSDLRVAVADYLSNFTEKTYGGKDFLMN